MIKVIPEINELSVSRPRIILTSENGVVKLQVEDVKPILQSLVTRPTLTAVAQQGPPGVDGTVGGLSNIVEDVSPQLGANLDLNTFSIGDANAADITKLSELTATSTELNYVDGVTSDIQTQLDGKSPTGHNHTGIYQPLASVLTNTTASFTSLQETKLANIENSATADQSDAEIETAYNNQVSIVSQIEAQSGVSTTARRWTAERVKDAIIALAPISGLSNLVEDTSPELGGNLDLNGFQVGDSDATDLTKLAAITVSATEVNYLSGTTSSVQTQLNGKAPVLGGDDNYVTDAEKIKLSNLSGTNTGDQTTIVGITGNKSQFNTAVTDGDFLYVGDITGNATHTGEVTGSTVLTVGKTAITNRTLVNPEEVDELLIADTSDTDNLKRITLQSLLDLVLLRDSNIDGGLPNSTFSDIPVIDGGTP